MNILKKLYNKILNKNNNNLPYTIYCDMDGVLVDLFEGGIYSTIKDPKNQAIAQKIVAENIKWSKIHHNKDIEAVLKHIRSIVDNNVEFWSQLDPKSDSLELWNYISQYDVKILSHPWDKRCIEGKKIWLANNLDPAPLESNIFLPLEGKKERWAVTNGKPNILIDDFEEYLKPWREAGGIAIHHTSTKSTIKALKELKTI